MIREFSLTPLSMVTAEGLQRLDLRCRADSACHAVLTLRGEGLDFRCPVGLASGENRLPVFLPPVERDIRAEALLAAEGGCVCFPFVWKKPRAWTFYVMLSSHTDIGLHNSQYHQRYYSEEFLDEAARLCDETEGRAEPDRYRYTMEGRWFWENYPADRGAEAAERMLRDYVRPGRIGLCAGIAGNHIFAYGLEELCRSTYGRARLLRDWGVDSHTLSMIDNNGLPWGMIGPYAEAGYRNILFAPNQWNPLPSTVWPCDSTIEGAAWNPNAGGGGSRIDVRYDSALPMLFFWESADGRDRLLVWASTQYGHGGQEFSFRPGSRADAATLARMESRFADRLPKMEARYPYDIWLLASYSDDQKPSLDQTDLFAAWNARWRYPQIRTLGDPDVPFELVRARYGAQIPVLRGEITGGWYQHPAAAPQLLADKLNADRALARAQTFVALAALTDGSPYPAQAFGRAWEYLLWNDEHSYGTSGYQGRRVYETWMQHRDWIEKAAETAQKETDEALGRIAAHIPAAPGSIVVFNSTGQERRERIDFGGRTAVVEGIPVCGYKAVRELREAVWTGTDCAAPPVVENGFYRIAFAPDGSMRSIFDKTLCRELLAEGGYGANCLVYTEDNHRSFRTPDPARFYVERADGRIRVIAETKEPCSGAAVVQTVTLDSLYPWIDIDNRLTHIRGMINRDRYKRYLYYAFPFSVENPRRICRSNGCEAEYARDLTGHGTDTYMSAHEWCCAENDAFGAALLQRDSLLVEFDHIHPDKTDCGAAGEGSAVYSYAANDWLQMHETGGSHVALHLRYAITSWAGSHTEAGLDRLAERWLNPVTAVKVSEKPAEPLLPAEMSFAQVQDGQRLVGLKRAEDGAGVVARLYGDRDTAGITVLGCFARRIPMDESDGAYTTGGTGFTTFRADTGPIPVREPVPDRIDEARPAPVGSVWTGLIDRPRAACGEEDGMLYLLWGANREKNLSHYELYRSEDPDFVPCEGSRIARVEPEAYRCGRYIDRGLETHTTYWYRVRAVNTAGAAGDFSEAFSGTTREPQACAWRQYAHRD